MKKTRITALLLTITSLCFGSTAFAVSYKTNFNNFDTGALHNQSGWTTSVGGSCGANIIQDPYDPYNKLIALRDNDGNNAASAFYKFPATNGIVTVQYDIIPYNIQCNEAPFQVRLGNNIITTIFRQGKNCWVGGVNGANESTATTGFLLYGPKPGATPGDTNRVYYKVVVNPNGNTNWYTIRQVLDFNTKTVDIYAGKTSDRTLTLMQEDCPFYTNSDSLDGIFLGTTSYGVSGDLFYDNIIITDGLIGSFNIDTNSAVYTLSGSQVTASANVIMPQVGAGTATVFAAAYDAEGRLVGAKTSPAYTQADLSGGVIPFSAAIPVSTPNVATVKLHLWESISSRTSYCQPVVCTLNN